MTNSEIIAQLEKRLKEPLPGKAAQIKMASGKRRLDITAPDTAKLSAVMGLLFPKDDELNLLLIKRVEDGKPHGGQISFPGGRKDKEDNDLLTTALRETEEEVGIPKNEITSLGALSSLYIPVSNSNVQPYIGYTSAVHNYILSPNEVQYIIEAPIKDLFAPHRKSIKEIRPTAYPEAIIKTPVYHWEGDHMIWGATAMIISELEAIIKL
ncbi:MAG: CoA pyrophosphatase [Flavipsychrobacter sp.]